MGLPPLDGYDCGIEFLRGNGCLSLVSVVYCQVEVSAKGRSLIQRSPTECGVSGCDRGTSQRRDRPISTVEPLEKNINSKKVTKTYVQSLARVFLKLCSVVINTADNFISRS